MEYRDQQGEGKADCVVVSNRNTGTWIILAVIIFANLGDS